MAHVVVKIGYVEYVLPAKVAMDFIEIMAKAEKFEKRFHAETKTLTYHIYPDETEHTLTILNNDIYNTAKLAGKPE